jgi:hypothetical protein
VEDIAQYGDDPQFRIPNLENSWLRSSKVPESKGKRLRRFVRDLLRRVRVTGK